MEKLEIPSNGWATNAPIAGSTPAKQARGTKLVGGAVAIDIASDSRKSPLRQGHAEDKVDEKAAEDIAELGDCDHGMQESDVARPSEAKQQEQTNTNSEVRMKIENDDDYH